MKNKLQIFIAKESFAGNNIIKLKKPVKYKTVDKRSYFRIIYMSETSYKIINIYNIPNIQGKYNRMVIPRVHSNNNNIIKPRRYSHKLRWYNITLQEKGMAKRKNNNINHIEESSRSSTRTDNGDNELTSSYEDDESYDKKIIINKNYGNITN
ncbi:hypothetical protein H8356DRAFT_1428822 [Neocallimastix lanati (nom. inval.)]|nr:hypothetical protein H8356DRAFT_1428822 [Neocallimastix sp. JGI-2020a]